MRTLLFSLLALISMSHHVAAQEGCNDLVPEVIGYSPFHSDSIEVRIINNGEIGWNYPSLILSDEAGDTIAWAPADFFALAEESIFSLPITGPGTVQDGPFFAQLALWTWFNDTLVCNWNVPVDLCPSDSCTNVHPFVLLNTQLTQSAEFPWTVTNEDGLVVASGTMSIDSAGGSAMDTVCLAPGYYALSMSASGVNEANVFYQMMGTAWNTSASPQVQMSVEDASTFTLFGACLDVDNAIQERPVSTLHARIIGDELFIDPPGSSMSAMVHLFDATGRMLHHSTTRHITTRIDLDRFPFGPVLIRLTDDTGIVHSARVVWAH